jgi:hypothetical protein
MHAFTQSAAIAVLAAIPLVTAHGHVNKIVADGKEYAGTTPEWFYNQASKPDTPGWYAENQDNGFVAPSAFSDPDIICHKKATVGGKPVPISAGGKLDLTWVWFSRRLHRYTSYAATNAPIQNTWPESHHGPVLTYMALVDGEFSAVDKASLKWFKIKEGGLISGSNPGTWASDELMANSLTESVTVPSNIKPGNYVVRHEIIGLHSAGNPDGAQNYPQCTFHLPCRNRIVLTTSFSGINVKVTGSGSEDPCSSGADCAVGTALYKEDDPGILISIYGTLSNYQIPGPALYGGGGGNKSGTAGTKAGSWKAFKA